MFATQYTKNNFSLEEQELIKLRLSEMGYPSMAIVSIDGKDSFSIYDFYSSSVIYSKFIQTSDIAALNQACDRGLYNALIERCKKNYETMSKHDYKSLEFENAIAEIQKDIKELSRIYWGIGYFQAGCILNQIACHLMEQNKATYNNSEASPSLLLMGKSILEQSVKCFLCASSLTESQYSNEILNNLTKDADLLGLLKGDLQFDNWPQAEIKFREWIGDNYMIQESAAKQELTELQKQYELNSKNIQAIFSELNEMLEKFTFLDALKIYLLNQPNISPENKRSLFKIAAKISLPSR
jgi:hypothetical protein